ncbi:glucose 1-dehydrogenase [Cladophialophora psammophila CBS 110553]|uniref:Glucose 1-dehydrogenase n=1 Tax=Cladophialophora psammophila CBS 110553 TaxID=1182543 RepID=W9W621_9EURO|nr:glucose 1-dehydrogenase [Cladophialophora psammophila CBS 110553]EXJ63547.1 glucose 1-dehydrogenase [Cladophialophora psammophila CBS 110553]
MGEREPQEVPNINAPEAATFPVLQGKVAVVTGAAMGMGKATALVFSKAGASVVLADINETLGQKAADEINQGGGKAYFVKTDVSNSDSVRDLVAETVAKFGKLDVAVNNAAMIPDKTPTAEFDEEYFDRVIAVNLKGPALCMKWELQQLLKQGYGGSIINIASINAFKPQYNMPAYTASKHAVVGLTKTAALEYGDKGIRVNTIAPGAILTEMSAASLQSIGTTHEAFSDLSYLKRWAAPHEVAQGSLWLASDAASYVTGITLPVCGGYSTR